MENLEQKVANLKEEMANAKAEATAAKEAASAIEQKVAEKETELKAAREEIDNLDASIKDQQKQIEELKKAAKENALPKGWKEDFRQALEAKKDEIKAAIADRKEKSYALTLELKTIYDVGTGVISGLAALGNAMDPNIVAAAPMGNAFLAVLGIRPRRGNTIGWVEGVAHSGAGYVAELANNNNKSDVTFTEKKRAFGKIATTMRISTEIEDWFEQIFNFCVNEGSKMVDAKIDDEIFNGEGVDGTYPNKIYGLKQSGQSTAYTPIASGSVLMANAADVLIDAKKKIDQAGYNANVAFVAFDVEAALKGLKNAIGGLLYNEYTGMLNGLRIVPSARLADGEALVMDTACAEVYGGNSYELEFIRNGAYDAYDVYFRKAAQVKVAATRKAGIQYIASMAESIALLDDGTAVTLSLSDSSKSIVKGAGNAYQITATVDPADTPLLWSSSDTDVATVASDGTVTGVAAGSAVILCQARNVIKTCILTVTNS